jgi:lysozyme
VKLSPAGAHLIASFEGFRPRAYNDSAHPPNCTIGYGHELHPGPCTYDDDNLLWTVDQAVAQLERDAQVAEDAVTAAVKVSLGELPAHAQARFDALVSLTFNIGAGAFTSSSLLREINLAGAPRDWTPLGLYWLEWDHAGGDVDQGLLNRRRAEFAIFAPGVYPAV